jgi:hypothetical protein
MPYRSLVIPCCKQCNGVHLSQLENRVKGVILDDSRSLDEIDDRDLNAWLSKIYIGILWKELELSYDRRNPDAGPILPPAVMSNFRMVHFFMQSCRKSMKFYGQETRFPNSLFRVECKSDHPYGRFDYLDSMMAHSVAIRMGNKGVVGIFDGGMHEMAFPDFAQMQFDRRPLHPTQFQEIFAKLTYKSLLSVRVPYYGFIYNEKFDEYTLILLAFDGDDMSASAITIGTEDSITMVPIVADSVLNGPLYGDWSQEEYAHILSMYTGAPVEQLFHPPDRVASCLRDENGDFVDL